MTAQAMLWALAVASLTLAVAAAVAEQRRVRRRNLDRPGWVPWNLVQVLAAIVAILAIVLAIRS